MPVGTACAVVLLHGSCAMLMCHREPPQMHHAARAWSLALRAREPESPAAPVHTGRSKLATRAARV
eukprot:scaffold1986_cov117-Isochrysis_galbana.AAC.3